MATINLDLLDEALKDGFIGAAKPAKRYIHTSVRRVNQMLEALSRAEQGLNLNQLKAGIDLDLNTLKIYIGWMRSRGLVRFEREPDSLRHVYFAVAPKRR